MKTQPYWESTAEILQFGPLKKSISVDVAVIGGGITGVTAAYLLKKAGASFALLEKGGFAGGETSHTTAHLTYVTDLRIKELARDFGLDHARAAWDAGQAAMDQIFKIVESEKIACEFAWVPGYLHAPPGEPDSETAQRLKEDAQLAAELGFGAAYMKSIPLMNRPGVRFSNQAKFHPRKYIAGLLAKLHGRGCHVYGQTEVSEIAEEPLRVKANGNEVRCAHVFIATHVPLQGLSGTLGATLFQTKLIPTTSYAIGAKIHKDEAPEASFWDTGDPYDYLRIDRHSGNDYAIFGGEDHKTGQISNPEERYASLEKKLHALIPGAVIDHYWSGQVIETVDGLPFIGETAPRQLVATGFSGNGMTLGTIGAIMARDAITGKRNPWKNLFSVDRKKLASAWDYLKENKDYPYYMIKDRLFGAGSQSLRGIRRGQGKVVIIKGEKVAASRNDDGRLTFKSAICTHMGCLLRWNKTEKTWDCPCHGSRFDANGKVIAGPAETHLEDIEPTKD